MTTLDKLTGRYEICLASDSKPKVRLLAALTVDGGWSVVFWVEGGGPEKEFASIAAACREYDLRVNLKL